MFSTILKEVTGYFDKRALMSAFFPAMIFWGTAIILVLLYRKGWEQALADWDKIPVTVQLLLLLAFFVWVAFWTFLTLNFQSLLLRVYEGQWPLVFLVQLRKRYWLKRWDAMDQRDNELGARESVLEGDRRKFESLRESLKASGPEKQPDPGGLIGGKIDLELSGLKEKLSDLEQEIAEEQTTREQLFSFPGKRVAKDPPENTGPTPGVYDQLAELGKRTRETWKLYLTHAPDLTSEERKDQDNPWARRRKKLDDLSGALTDDGKNLRAYVNQQRLSLHHEFFLMFPPYRNDVVATHLGNVLKAAEERVRLRYALDALLAWSRLESLLPKEAAESLQNAKTSLDLMLNLSASLLLFGLPLSVWIMLQTTKWFLWWVPLILLVVALVARLRVAAIPAVIALVVSLFLPVSNGAQKFLSGTEAVLTAFAALSLISWLCYQNAVESCLVYGEKIQSAFDLYRWKLFDELHLQLPPNLEEERKMWEEIGGLLYRGYEPSPDYYRYVQDDKKTKAPVVEVSSIPPPVFAASLPADQPNEHVAVGLEVNQADILGGKLAPDDRVDIIITAYNVKPVSYENILVLDVSVVDVARKNGEVTAVQPVVVVALSRAQQEDFIVKRRFGKVNLTRRI